MLTYVEHDSLREAYQAKLAGIVRRALREEVSARQTSDSDQVAFRSDQFIQSRFNGVEHPGQVDVDRLSPLLRGKVLNASEMSYAGIGHHHINATKLSLTLLHCILLASQIAYVRFDA